MTFRQGYSAGPAHDGRNRLRGRADDLLGRAGVLARSSTSRQDRRMQPAARGEGSRCAARRGSCRGSPTSATRWRPSPLIAEGDAASSSAPSSSRSMRQGLRLRRPLPVRQILTRFRCRLVASPGFARHASNRSCAHRRRSPLPDDEPGLLQAAGIKARRCRSTQETWSVKEDKAGVAVPSAATLAAGDVGRRSGAARRPAHLSRR